MSKPLLKSDRDDVRALDEVFHALRGQSQTSTVRILRFYCASQGIVWQHLFPEAAKNV